MPSAIGLSFWHGAFHHAWKTKDCRIRSQKSIVKIQAAPKPVYVTIKHSTVHSLNKKGLSFLENVPDYQPQVRVGKPGRILI
jgi:hypothetical protein